MSLIAETSNPLLLQALQARLQRRGQPTGAMGALEPVALRLGLLQHSMKPRLREPRLLLCVADHGLAVDGIHAPRGRQTDELVHELMAGQSPVVGLAQQLGIALTVVDCGVASQLPARDGFLQRKIAHGTRNARVSQAMSLEQAHAAIRAGMEIGDSLRGNLVACAGLGVGSAESAALVLSRLADLPLRDLVSSGPQMNPEIMAHLMVLLQGAQGRHREVSDPVEVLAAFGGFETGVMAGVMLVAASKRHLILIDGMAACAALLVASRIAPAVTDYCVFCRSSTHQGLDQALQAFQASALLDLGLDTLDGTGACLVWPMVQAAAALLADTGAADAPSSSQPIDLDTGSSVAPDDLGEDSDPTVPGGLR
jgi:nicotinate-nucleotide--dimethylbenzimidazole phosphoribosyltransferase